MANYPFDGEFWPAREDYWVAQARNELRAAGYQVTAWGKAKSLNKFGRTSNADSGVKTTVGTFQGTVVNETLATTNSIDSIVSDSASDTTDVLIEGQYLSGSDWVFATQTVTLTGTTPVTLSQPLIRCTRLKNAGATDFVGNIYCYDSTVATTAPLGVPSDATATKAMIVAGKQQTEKCATSISSSDVWIITGAAMGCSRGNASINVDFDIEYKSEGGVWLPLGLEAELRSGSLPYQKDHFHPYRIIYPKTDVRMVATSNTDNSLVAGRIVGILASVES